MKYTREIKKGMSGNDVFYIKNKLFDLGMYAPKIKKISSKTFRADSVLATKNFQTKYHLDVTGTVNEITWNKIEEESQPEPAPTPPTNLLDEYTWLDPKKRAVIEKDLVKVSELRRNICLEILKYAYDPMYRKGDVRALYMWGANLYNTDLRINIATKAKIESGAKKYPQHYNEGRKEWMLAQVEKNPNLPASDCSGMEVGYLRKFKLVKNTFDVNANRLGSKSYSIQVSKAEAIPGTFAHKDGHIGTYVGGGYVVEFVGGAYGCQLSARDKRKVWNFIDKRIHTMSDWTDYWNFKEIAKYD